MKKRILSLCMVLVLCLGLLPTTVLAAENAPTTLYVGNYQITNGNATTYFKAGSTQGSLVDGSENDWTVKYDPSTATLTLNGATITGNDNISSVPYGAGIYAQCNSGQPVTLTIELIGENIITGNYGIYVNAEMSANSYGTDASLNITGNGSLIVNGTNSHGLFVKSGTGSASLTINDASVVANTTHTYSGPAGICVQSSVSATSSPNLSLAVDGGSLTASGTGNSDGILLYVGSSQATGATTSLTVTDNAIVRAKNGIKAERVDKPTPSGAGIVFDGGEGTVYGNVTLQKNLIISEGESLTLNDGASLDANGYNVIVDGGTLDENLANSLGNSMKYTPTITTTSLPNGTVGTHYEQKLTTDGTEPIKWSISNGSLPAGLSLNEDTGEISGTPTAAGSNTFTITAENAYDMKTRELTITVDDALVYSISLTPNIVKFPSLIEGYEPQDPKTITIKNTGNQTIKIAYYGSGGSEFDIALDKTVLKPNEEATLTIRLKDGLSAATPSTLQTSIRYTSEDGTYENRVPYEVYRAISHDMDYIEAKDPTHLEDGNIEYWYCRYCDKYYKDGTGNNELNLEDIIIPKLSEHSSTRIWRYDDNSHYHICECGEILDRAAHSYKWVIDKEATSTSTGLKHEECTVCGHQKEAVVIPALEVEIPDTGVKSNTSVWIATILLSISVVLTGTVIYQRKKKEN